MRYFLRLGLLALATLTLVACSDDPGDDPPSDASQPAPDVADAASPDDTSSADATEDAIEDATSPADTDDAAAADTGDSSRPDGNSGDAATDTRDVEHDTSRTDADTGPNTTPLAGLQLFTDGCESELWGRWQNTRDWNMTESTLRTTGGDQVANSQHLDPVSFHDERADTYLFWDDVSVPESRYTLDLALEDGTTMQADLPVTSGLPPAKDLYTIVDRRLTDADELVIDVEPNFTGSLYEQRVYDADECMITRTQHFDGPPLDAGTPATVELGDVGDSGDTVHVMLRGADESIDYTNYDLLTLQIP